MKKKTLITTLIVPISLGAIMWYGELPVSSDQNTNVIKSSMSMEVLNNDLKNVAEVNNDIEVESEVKIETQEQEQADKKVDLDEQIDLDKDKDLVYEVNVEESVEVEIEVKEKEKDKDKDKDKKAIDAKNIDNSNKENQDISKTDDVIENISSAPDKEETEMETKAPEVKPSESKEAQGNNLNKYVLNVISTYPTGSSNYPYLLNNDYANYNGVTETLYYKGEILAKGHPSGVKYSHCSGITFEVFFKAMQARNKALGLSPDNFNNMSKDQLFDFLLTWYAATGPKSQSNISVAVEKYGLGKRITNLEDAVKGDFIDISRTNGTGHTVVFLNWIREGNNIVGMRYWSSQQSTNGIAYNEEYFNVKRSNGKIGKVIKDKVYIARVF